MTDDRQESVAFDPVRIGGRRRGVDPVLIGALAVVVGLMAAIVKPWEERPQTAQASLGVSVAPSEALPSPTAPSSGPTPASILLDDPLATVTVLEALDPHDEWGVRIVERAPDWRTGYRERWLPAPVAASGNRQVTVRPSDRALVLGITAPASQTPLDLRVFRTSGTGAWTWLDVPRVVSDRPDAAFLLRPPRVAGRDRAAWLPGIYRVELLMGDGIETVDLALTDRDGRVPDPPRFTRLSEGVIAAGTELATYRTPGAFLIVDTLAVPLTAAAGRRLEAPEAWLGRRADEEPTEPTVATIFQPDATALAVMLPVRAAHIDADFARVSPSTAGPLPSIEVSPAGDRPDMPPFVSFPAPDGRAWPAGTYAMHVSWTDPDGTHDRTWHVTLLPGDPDREPAMLSAARSFQPFAGRDGLIVGPVFHRDGVSGTPPARLFAFDRSGPDPTRVEPIACDETFIGGKPEVVGLSHALDAVASQVTAEVLLPDGRSRAIPLRTAALPGLMLVEPMRGVSFPQGVYRFEVAAGTGARTQVMVCLGTSPFEG